MTEKKETNELPKSVIGFLDKYGDKLYNGVKSIYKKASDETRLNWRLGYEYYLDSSYKKYYYAKTFLSTNEPLPLYDFYVPLSVSCGKNKIDNTSIEDLMSFNKFSIIMASGGSGKTMMMRHLFVDTIAKTSLVPIFVELRELNNSELNLFSLIIKKLRDNKFDFADEYIEMAFKAGHFALLLDGFDEVIDTKRESTIKQIEEISQKYEKNYIILSSRPDDSLNKWILFNVWEVEPLTLTLACELVEKTDSDEEIKQKFIEALKESLFETHSTFLSNPLLLSIMLITYKDGANIPQKITTFYERAYMALFEQHDAKKAYHREKRSKLDILDFKKVFSAFCFLTYNKSRYNFPETIALEYLEKAKKASIIEFNKKDYLHDAIQAVCLLIRDGLDITFSHRSFQEYFTAVFVSQLGDVEKVGRFLNSHLLEMSWTYFEVNTLFELIYEISPELIEKQLIIPNLEEIEIRIGYVNKLEKSSHKKLIKLLYSNLHVASGGDFSEDYTDQYIIGVGHINRHYHNIIDFITKTYFADYKPLIKDNSDFAKILLEISFTGEIDIDLILKNDGLF
ncbi:MAG TPA: NACHT domain-containing protein, partial [Pyrinomonadaceae bacterium]|nr:NACHT domain-containing protein [Pyrinomonadaceae bacterium]